MVIRGYKQVTPILSGSIPPNLALECYANGLFIMSDDRISEEYAWFTHLPRGVLPLDNIHISKSLQKELRKNIFDLRCDHAFEQIIDACADRRGMGQNDQSDGTWISEPIKDLFLQLHELGYAHSIECWKEGELVGGLYGLHIGGAFFGESMFSRQSNASKIALVYLVEHLKNQGISLLDVQQTNPHTLQFGAVDVHENEYLNMLKKALTQDIKWGRFHPHHMT